MIGIYKYTNKTNNKIYIGMSNDILRRKWEHQTMANRGDDTYFHHALAKYGSDNFIFEVIETFDTYDPELLGEREKYWIQYYNSQEDGYNETSGGDLGCGRAKLTKEDVIAIRIRYQNRERCMDVYEDYKHLIKRSGFNKIWKGETWKYIMPEIYTLENRIYHKMHTSNPGQKNGRTKLTDQDVYNMRLRYKNGELAKDIYEDYKDKITYRSFQNILCYRNWKHIIV